jgi:hypothetical protein
VSAAIPAIGALAALFAKALALTILVEVAVGALLGIRSPRGIATVALMNVVTNPPLVWVLAVAAMLFGIGPASTPAAYWGLVALLEAIVVTVEWRILRWVLGLESRRALWLSIALNAASFGLGLLLGAAGLWA